MQRRFSDWVDDPRVVTIAVTALIAAALWVATWSVMGRMDMSTMGMSGMEMGTMPADGSTMTMPMNDADDAMNGTGEMGDNGTMQGTDGMDGTMQEADGMDGTMPGKGGMDGAMQGEMGMWGMSMDPTDWSAKTIYEASMMWMLMMAAMMLPAMSPVMAIYSGIAAKEDRGARLAARIAIFTSGYFVLWALFSIALALVQLGLRGSSLFTMGGTQATPLAAAALMVAAGLYQLSPVKDACLRHCRHPLMYLMTHWREGLGGAFRVGATHGIYCVGCCGLFMGLMFVFGAMNIWWMAVIAVYFLAEKIAPQAERWGRLVGYALILCGLGAAVAQAL